MNDEQALKMTELDYMTAVPHLQMIKAALPYVNVSEQRFISMFVKASELRHTMRLFDDAEEGAVGICSLEADAPSSPLDMLSAMKPYGTEPEQEFIDLIINFLESSRIYQSYCDSTEGQEELHAADQPPTQIPGRVSGNENQNQRPTEQNQQQGQQHQRQGQQNQRQGQQQQGSQYQQQNSQYQQQGSQQNRQQNQQNQQQSQQQNQQRSRQNGNRRRNAPIEQIMNMLPPEQQSKLETAQLLMQTFQQFQ